MILADKTRIIIKIIGELIKFIISIVLCDVLYYGDSCLVIYDCELYMSVGKLVMTLYEIRQNCFAIVRF